MEEGLENPWCVYEGLLNAIGFGKIEREDNSVVYVRYSEGQLYPPEPWDPRYIRKFCTLEEAIDYYIENRPEVDVRERPETEKEIRARAKMQFPSCFK